MYPLDVMVVSVCAGSPHPHPQPARLLEREASSFQAKLKKITKQNIVVPNMSSS